MGGIGEDTSGNGNHWDVLGMTAHPIVPDSPGNNFATLNPIGEGLTGTMSEGNLKYTTGNVHSSTRGNFYVSSGKWYWEVYIGNLPVGTHVGISSIDEVVSTSGNVGNWQKNNAIAVSYTHLTLPTKRIV